MLDEAKASGALKTAQDIREVSTHLDLEFLHKIWLSIVKDAMDTTLKSDHSHTSLKNEHGNYPKWLSKRKIAQMKKVKQKKKVTKKQNQKKSKV